jgi:hypothetical protein
LPAQNLERFDHEVDVLPRVECRDRENVGCAEVGALPLRLEQRLDPGVRDTDSLLGDLEVLDDIVGGEAGVGEDDVAGGGGVPVLGPVHPQRSWVNEVRKMKRHEVVDRGCPHATSLRRVHPVREMEDVEPADEPLEGKPARPAPGDAKGVGCRKGDEPLLDRCRAEGLPDLGGSA